MAKLLIKQVSSLEKIFLNELPKCDTVMRGSMLKSEEFSYQVAYTYDDVDGWYSKGQFKLNVISDLEPYITVRNVENIPSEMAVYPNLKNEGYLSEKSGLYPDALIPMKNNEIEATPGLWHSLWISVKIPAEFKAGVYPIEIQFKIDKVTESTVFNLEIIDAALPEQKLIYTDWFYCDCIATAHKVKVFSKKHWALIEKYMKTAADNGMNMILTPIFTPPLDTQIGGERPTVQLVDCYLNDGKYTFGFDKLSQWIDMCQNCGIKYFEISHLFTQWGAKATPKILVTQNGRKKNLFGWKISATSKKYSDFMDSFLPELIQFLKKKKIANNTYFHISDEPSEENQESYLKAKNVVAKHLKEFKIIDALSHVDMYKKGIVQIPVPVTNSVDDFLKEDISERWTYYCCSGITNVSNRFFSMPSTRNRIIGAQLYKFNMDGFLHWGYNFYFSQYSKEIINPYLTTDAKNAFPSGDAFCVYPYENTVAESIRLKVFNDALQDMRAMQLLEKYKGKKYVVDIIEKYTSGELKFDKFPYFGNYIITYREQINQEIKKQL